MEQLTLRSTLHQTQPQGPPPSSYLLPSSATSMVLDNGIPTANGLIDPTTGYPHPHPHPPPQQMIPASAAAALAQQQHHLSMNHHNDNVGVVMLEEGSEWPKIGAQIRSALEQAQQQALQRRRQMYPSTVPPPESPKLSKSSSNLLTSSSGGLNNNASGNSNAIDLDVPHSPTRLREEDMHVFGISPTTDPLLLVTCSHCNKTLKASHFCAHLARCPTKSGNLENSGARSSASSHKSHHADKDHSSSSTKRKQSSSSKSSAKRQKTEDGPVEAPVDERAQLKSSTGGSSSSTKKSSRKSKKEEEEEQQQQQQSQTKKSKRERDKEKEREKEKERAEREKAEQEKAEKEREEKEKEAASTTVRGRPRKRKETAADKAAREEEEKKAQAKAETKPKKEETLKEDSTAAAAATAPAAATAATPANSRGKKKPDLRTMRAEFAGNIQQKVDAWIRSRSTTVRGKSSSSSSKKQEELSASSSSVSLSSSSSTVPIPSASHSKRGHSSHEEEDMKALVSLLDEIGRATPIPLAIKMYTHHNKLRHIFNTLIPVPSAIGQYCLLGQHIQGSIQSQAQNGIAVLSSAPNNSDALLTEQPISSSSGHGVHPHPQFSTQPHTGVISMPHQVSHTTASQAGHPALASATDSKGQVRGAPQGSTTTPYTAKFSTSGVKDGQQSLYIQQQPPSQSSQETTAPSPNSSPNASSSSPRRKRKETTRGRGKAASSTSSSNNAVPVQPAANGVPSTIAPAQGPTIIAARPTAIVHNVDPTIAPGQISSTNAGATATVAVPAQVTQSGQIYPPRAVYVAYPNAQAGANGGAPGSIIIAPQPQAQVLAGTNTMYRNIRPFPVPVVGVKGTGQQIIQIGPNGVPHQNPAGHPTMLKNVATVPIHEQQRPKDPQQKLIVTVNPMLGKDNKLHQPIQPAGVSTTTTAPTTATATATTTTARNANPNSTG